MVIKDTPLISVIVPVYNAEPYLQRCLESILSQTNNNIEVLLVDDGSTDESGAICDMFAVKDSRVRVIHQANGGTSSARNSGLDAARGSWIGFVDADDWIEPQMYERLLHAGLGSGKHLVSCGYFEQRQNGERNYINIPGNYTNLPDWSAPEELTGMESLAYALRTRYFSGSVCTVLFDRTVLDGKQGDPYIPLRLDTKLYNNEDVEFLIRVLTRANGVAIVPEAFYCYYQGSVSASRTFTARQTTVIDAWERIIGHAALVSADLVRLAKISHTEMAFDLIRRAVQNSMYDLLPELRRAARRYIKSSLTAKEVRLRRKLSYICILASPRLFVPFRENLRKLLLSSR